MLYLFLILLVCSCGHNGITASSSASKLSESDCRSRSEEYALDERIRSAIYDACNRQQAEEPNLIGKKMADSEVRVRLKIADNEAPLPPAYLFETRGFSRGDIYTFYQVNMCYGKFEFGDYVVNEELELVKQCDGKRLSEWVLFASGYMNGERTSFVLVPKDEKKCIAASFAPNPVEYEWDDGAYLYLSMESPTADLFTLTGRGFHPGEKLTIRIKSCDECINHSIVCDDGTVSIIIAPAVVNKKGGAVFVKIKREYEQKPCMLKFWWGLHAKKKAEFKIPKKQLLK